MVGLALLLAGCSHANSQNSNNAASAGAPACQPTIGAGGGSNSIDLTDVQGDTCLATGSGSITIRGARGRLSLLTGSGSVLISGLDGSVSIRSGSGSVTIDGRLQGDNTITTGSDSATMRLGGNPDLTVDIATGNGSISDSFGLHANGTQLQGKIGSGAGGSLVIRTGSGSVSLQK